MNRMNKKLSILMIGLAMGAAAPSMPAWAADGDKAQAERIDKGKVPDAALAVLQQQMGSGAKGATYHRVEQGGQKVYEVRFEDASGRETRASVTADGRLVQAADGGSRTVDRTPLTPAPLPAGGRDTGFSTAPGSLTPEQARTESQRLEVEQNRLRTEAERLAVEVQRLEQRHRDLDASTRQGDRNAAAQQERLRTERERLLVEHQRLQTEIARIEQRQRDVSAAAGGGTRFDERGDVAAATGTGVAERDRDDRDQDIRYTRITRNDVPEGAYRAMEKYTRGTSDQWYRRETIGERTYYSVHYVNPDNNKRYWLSVDRTGELRVEPRLSIYQPSGAARGDTGVARTDRGDDRFERYDERDDRDRDSDRDEVRYTKIREADVPPAALRTMDKYVKGNTPNLYRREVRGDRVSYSVHYLTPERKQYWISVNSDGSLRSEPKLSVNQPAAGRDRDNEARPASGRDTTPNAGRVTYTKISRNDVPDAVLRSVTRQTDGARDTQFLRSVRDGRDFYSVLYTTRDNRRMEARFDDRGTLVDGPHLAREQPGDRDSR